jgi:hypothetical protein
MQLCSAVVDDFLTRCLNAGIKDPAAYLISKRPQVYDWLVGCFPRGILPTDVDGEVEVGGYFLRLEFKHEDVLRSGRVKRGQMMLFQRLVETKKFTVFLVGVSDQGEPTCIEIYGAKGHKKLHDLDRSRVQEYCRDWAQKAEKGEL